jgi:hypothetical protein
VEEILGKGSRGEAMEGREQEILGAGAGEAKEVGLQPSVPETGGKALYL